MTVLNTTGYAAAEALRQPHRFTIMLPIVRPPTMLPHAVRSILAQTETDFELCIICDGAPLETVACAESMKRDDPRIRVFAFAKGQRHGEAHRSAVLSGSRADYVAQIGDDDLWFPDHLTTLARYLKHADFVSLCQVRMHDGDKVSVLHYGDLGDSHTRELMQRKIWNFFSGVRKRLFDFSLPVLLLMVDPFLGLCRISQGITPVALRAPSVMPC